MHYSTVSQEELFMVVHQVEYGKISHENSITFGSQACYLYIVCRNAVRVHWQTDVIAQNGGQIFLYPGQSFTVTREESVLLYDLLEFSPEDAELKMLDTLPLPETFTCPAHLAELSTRARAIYDIHFSADKYRSEKATLLGQMLLYSISSGDPDGDFLVCDTVVDHRRSFVLTIELQLSAIAIADSGDWADDFYLRLSSDQRRNSNDPYQIILECESLRKAENAYILGLSCHICENGTWKDRIFKNSAELSHPISNVHIQYHYNAATHSYRWVAKEATTETVIHRYTTSEGLVPREITNNPSIYIQIYRNPTGINIKNLSLQYTDKQSSASSTKIRIQYNTDSLSPKGLIDRKLRRLRTLISDDPSKDWTIQKAAAYINLSESRFYSLYKQYFGQTFMSDVIRSRINFSCFLLTTTQEPIKEIAKRVGYENESLFYRQFKEKMGISPREYQKMYIRSV